MDDLGSSVFSTDRQNRDETGLESGSESDTDLAMFRENSAPVLTCVVRVWRACQYETYCVKALVRLICQSSFNLESLLWTGKQIGWAGYSKDEDKRQGGSESDGERGR